VAAWANIRNSYLNVFSFDAHIETVNRQLWIVAPCAVTNFKSPGVPRTGDDAVLHFARAQGRPHVWAQIVDRKVFSTVVKQGDRPLTEGKRLALTLWNGSDSGNGCELGHRCDLFPLVTRKRSGHRTENPPAAQRRTRPSPAVAIDGLAILPIDAR